MGGNDPKQVTRASKVGRFKGDPDFWESWCGPFARGRHQYDIPRNWQCTVTSQQAHQENGENLCLLPPKGTKETLNLPSYHLGKVQKKEHAGLILRKWSHSEKEALYVWTQLENIRLFSHLCYSKSWRENILEKVMTFCLFLFLPLSLPFFPQLNSSM